MAGSQVAVSSFHQTLTTRPLNRTARYKTLSELGIGQSRVSDLVRGKWDKFSLDMLITLAARAGKRIELAMA